MRTEGLSTLGVEALREVGTAFQAESLARRYYDLFNDRRLDEAERMVDPQAVFTYPEAKEHLIGRAGYRELARRWIDAFPDGRVRILHAHVGEGLAVRVDLLAEGTHLGILELPGLPTIPPTGRHAQLLMRETNTVRNGLIVACRLEVDTAALRRALGIPQEKDGRERSPSGPRTHEKRSTRGRAANHTRE